MCVCIAAKPNSFNCTNMSTISDSEDNHGPGVSNDFDENILSESHELVIDPFDPTPFLDANDMAARREEFDSLKAIYTDDDIKFKEWDDRLGFKFCFKKM